VRVLPNTAGCHSAKEAVTTARMARDIFQTAWIKLEVIGDADTLQPDAFGLVEAAAELCADGFEVFPYTTEDLVVADRLLLAGCRVLMPWGAPIGSGRGLNNRFGLRTLRAHFPDVPLIIDAGIGRPSHAVEAMELGFDGVLLNTAVALAGDPVAMAAAFARAVEAGRAGFEAQPMAPRDLAEPSTPIAGKAWLA
jgi:thiazole synthase